MAKIFKPRSNQNKNDCWCDALSFAVHKPYNEIREMMKPFINDEGGLSNHFIYGYLILQDFKHVELQGCTDTVCDLYQQLDSRNNDIVIVTDKHVAYLSDNRFFDNIEIEKTSEYLNTKAEAYLWKAKETTKKDTNIK
jgi:hypothetical protein